MSLPAKFDELVERVASRLIGQCTIFDEQAIDEAAEELGIPVEEVKANTAALTEALDMKYFWCDDCGWCCDIEELHDDDTDQLCDDCSEEDY